MTIKEASANLGKQVKYRDNPYTIAAIIKRLTGKGVVYQVELSPMNYGNGIVIARAEDIEI